MNIKNIPGENNTASIGISFDIPNEREIIAIGSPDKLKAYFTLGIENPEIEIRTRKLGSLVDEMNELAQSEADDKMQILAKCSNGLCGIISEGQGNKSAEEYINALAELYDSSNKGNMLLNFMIFFILTNYRYNHRTLNSEWHVFVSSMKKSAARFAEQFNICVSDMLLPFRNLPTVPESNVRYWNIPEQINASPTDLTVHIYYTHLNGTWQTAYVADDSFLAVLRIYVDMLKQANRIVSNCTICGKLIIKDKTNNSDFCSQECRNVHKREWTKENRIKNAESDVQNIYTTFYNNTNNQKRKLKRSPEALEKYNVRFNELKEKALTMKRGLSDDSPMSEILAYSEQLLDWEAELRGLADQLREKMGKNIYVINVKGYA